LLESLHHGSLAKLLRSSLQLSLGSLLGSMFAALASDF